MTGPDQQEESVPRKQEIEEARRRIDQGERPWEEEQGILSVVEAARDMEFPTDAGEMAACIGDREVRINEDTRVEMRRVLGKLKDDKEFSGFRDFQRAVQKHWQGIRNLEVPPEQWPPQ